LLYHSSKQASRTTPNHPKVARNNQPPQPTPCFSMCPTTLLTHPPAQSMRPSAISCSTLMPPPLPQIANLQFGAKCDLWRLVIANHWPTNLANLLCPWKMERTPYPTALAHV
jgi:hypothetical protein